MKKMLIFVLIMMAAAGLMITSAAAAPTVIGTPDYRTVKSAAPSGMVPLYENASSAAPCKAQFYSGTVAAVFTTEGEWAYVQVAGYEGYMQNSCLAAAREAVSPRHPKMYAKPVYGVVLKMDTLSTVTVPYLTELTVLGVRETLAIVQYGGMVWEANLTDLSYGSPAANQTVVTPQPVYTPVVSPTATPFVFTGPVGYHEKADWPFAGGENVAAVTNPNTSHRLNLRQEPDKNSKSLSKYYNGVLVTVEGEIVINAKGEKWVPVSIGELKGYMDASFLTFPGEKEFPASVMPVMKVKNYNAVGNLHLREKQSMDSTSLGLYNNGTEVILMGFNGEWAHVIVDGKTGFMMAKYLK